MTLTSIDPHTTSLSILFRDGSKAEHEETESASFITELLAGRVNEQGYADYLARLQRVYVALETVGASMVGDPIASAVLDAALERSAAIAADVAHWGAGDGASAATDAYVARVEQIADSPVAFVAHHYTRYLGDLSGGRVIGRILSQTFELGESGAAFYNFPEIAKPKTYKDAYRARLDDLPLTADEKLLALQEVKAVFGFNGAIFGELTDALPTYRR